MITLLKLKNLSLAFLLTLSFCANASPPRKLSFSLERGNLLSIIEPYGNKGPEAKEARARYYDKALSLARDYGFQNQGALRVTETLVGEEYPSTFVLATWPNLAADDTFEALPQWQEYKALRPIIWQTLRFYKASAQHASTLTFEENNLYTLTFASRSAVNKNGHTQSPPGSSVVHYMDDLRFVTHSAPFQGPDEVSVLHWQSEEALNTYVQALADSNQKAKVYRIAPVFR